MKRVRWVMLLFACLSVACSLVGGAETSRVDADPTLDDLVRIAKVGGAILILDHQGGRCSLRIGNGGEPIILALATPCGFVCTTADSPPQRFHYPGIGHVLVVAGPPAPPSDYEPNGSVHPEHLCSNEGQALIFNDGMVTLRPPERMPLTFCHNLGFDEKRFYGFAHNANSR